MDQAIVDDLRRRFGLKVGLAAAEQLRMEIGGAYPLDEELVEEVAGVDVASGLPRRLTITSDEIRTALAEPLESIIDAIRQTVDGCTPDLAADLVQHGLVLCGGAALVRGLDRFISERTGIPARVADDALGAVAQGMVICLEHMDAWRRALESSDDSL
jgi:rod shape-determining protein MreB